MKSYLYLLVVVLVTQACAQTKKAQTSASEIITVTKATEQRWSGGIAGRMGTSYSITFETKPNLIADTVWIDSHYFLLIDPKKVPMDEAPVNWKVERNADKWIYDVSVGIDRSHYTRYSDSDSDAYKEKNVVHQPVSIGVAYITYSYNGKRGGKSIATFKQLPPLSYP